MGLAWVLIHGLQDNLMYYRTPAELVAGTETGGDRVRLGGEVRPGSVVEANGLVTFMLQDGTSAVPVVLSAAVPATFGPGEGAIVEGVYGPDQVMHADAVLMKHDERYSPLNDGQG